MGWLTGYEYRKKCSVVATSAGAQTNYQLELKVGESSGASGADVHCNNKCNDFPNDIRFTKEDGLIKHDYWVESITGTSPNRLATVVIEVVSIPASGSIDFYMYYGRVNDIGESNGDDTFEFFDDFEGADCGWSPYVSNPVLSPEGDEDLTSWGSVWKDGTAYHMFYSYKDVANVLQIGHATSSDGKSWTKDTVNNPILIKSGSGWDNGIVWDPAVWKESSTWYMLYTGRNSGGSAEAIGLATASSPSGPWTKEPTNPVLEGTVGEWDENSAENMNLIKVGSTYYLWYNTLLDAGANRKSGLATSTNLTTWTKDANNPIFGESGGYFQAAPFKYGSYYYLLMMHYTSGTDYSDMQLYRDTNPTFYSSSRELVRICKTCGASGWDSHDQDTPCVLTTDINRDSFPSPELWIYYAGEEGGVWKTGLLIETDIATALATCQAYNFSGKWSVVGTPETDNSHVRTGETSTRVINTEYLSKDWGANKQWHVSEWFYNTNEAAVGHWVSVLNNLGNRNAISFNKLGNNNFLYKINGGGDVDTGILATIGWHNFEIKADGTDIKLYIDDVLIATDSGHGFFTKIEYLGNVWTSNTDPSWFDSLLVTKHASPEPTWGNWGSEQSITMKESTIGLLVVETFTKESSIGLSVGITPTKESSIGLSVGITPTKESLIGLMIVDVPTKESSIGIMIGEIFIKESSIGLMIIQLRRQIQRGVLVFNGISEDGRVEISPGLLEDGKIGKIESITKESSIGLSIKGAIIKSSSIGLSIQIERGIYSSIGLMIVDVPTKESSIGITVTGGLKLSSIGLDVGSTKLEQGTGIVIFDGISEDGRVEISPGLLEDGNFKKIIRPHIKESSIGLSVQETFTKESSIGLSVQETFTKESSIGLSVQETFTKESSIGLSIHGPNTKESSITLTVIDPVLYKGFYYAKLGNTALDGVEEDNFRISKEINQIPSFNYEIANCADNRTTITDNITEEFKIYWRHHGTDTHIFTGIINADGIEYISLDSIEITGYASYVVLSWPLLKHLAAEDAESVNTVFNFDGFYTNYTAAANNDIINDVFVTFGDVNQALYIGENQPFWGAQIKYSTKGVRPVGCNIVLEYSKGTGVWGTLDALDESDAFTEDPGTYNLIIPHPPSDWARNIVDGVKRYWIRWRLAAGVYSTPPKLDQIYIVNVDIYRTYYFDTSARAILLDALEGTDYTMDTTDSCPEDIISVVAEYESPLRVIAAIPNALTWTDTDGSKKAYQWWIDDSKKVHMKQRRGTVQPDDVTGDMTIFNNHEDYFHLSNRLIGLGPRDGLGQMRAIIEDKTSITTHTLREIAVAKDQILKYNMLKTSLEKDIAISKSPMQRIRGSVSTEFWGLRGYEVGDTVTLHQGKWNVAEKAFQIVKAEIGPNTTTIDLGISQDHLNGLRDSLQRQLTLNNVRMHGSTTVFEAGPETSNYQRKSATEVYSAKLNVEIPTDIKKIHKVLVSWTLGKYRASVEDHTSDVPAHDHAGWVGDGGGIDADYVGLGGSLIPDVDADGDHIPTMLGEAHKHYLDDELTIQYGGNHRWLMGPINQGAVLGGNHRHIKGRTDGPDDTTWAYTQANWDLWCDSCDAWLINSFDADDFAMGSHWHLNANEDTKYTAFTNPNMYVDVKQEFVVEEINPYVQHTLTQNESPEGHEHTCDPVGTHDHPGVYQEPHNDHMIPLEPPHNDHAITPQAGSSLDVTYGIREFPSGNTLELLVNSEKVGEYTSAQTEIRIDGWLTSGNNVIEIQPVIGENVKGGVTIKSNGILFVEPRRF